MRPGLIVVTCLILMTSLSTLLLAACNQRDSGTDPGESEKPKQTNTAPNSNAGQTGEPASEANKNVGASAAQNQVVIDNFAFKPAILTVKAGTQVTWVNQDDMPHTVTDGDKQFDSRAIDTDGQFAHTFSAPGTYRYFCKLHPKMIGQVVVK